MRVLYCALKYDYGIPSRGFSYEHDNFYGTLSGMPNIEVEYYPFDEIMRRVGRRAMNVELVRTVERTRPDLCFFVLFTDEISKETLRGITHGSRSLTFNWFSDDHWRFDSYSKYWAPLFHWVSTTDSKAVDKYRAVGYNTVIKTQWACNPNMLREPRGCDAKYGVTFIGQPHSERRRTIAELERHGVRVECWGQGWPNGRLSQKQMIEIYCESKINLNIGASSVRVGWKPAAKMFLTRRADDQLRVNTPAEFMGHLKSLIGSHRSQIKARNFEIPGAGGFLLTSPADNLEEYYLPDKEIAVFHDSDELVEKIRYYLSHPEERGAIRKAGFLRTRSEHTYVHRFNEIFHTMGLVR